DGRLGKGVHQVVKPGQFQGVVPDGAVLRGGSRQGFLQFGQGHAGAERRAGGGQDHAAHGGSMPGTPGGFPEGGDQRLAEGVAAIRTVDGEQRGRTPEFVQDQRFAHRTIASRFAGRWTGIRSRARASVLPWVSARSERLAPPAKTSYSTKFRASKF